jgi:hypothetical protein
MADLRTLHEDLLAALDALEALTAQPTANETELSGLRYRLTRISTERRKMIDSLFARLAETAPPDQAAHLRALSLSHRDARMKTTEHIGAWSLRRVADDWPGYCRASAKMRAAMRQIALEQAVLYPLIDAGFSRDAAPKKAV